jgi:hypothetical protein
VARHIAIDVIRREARRQLREQLYTQMSAAHATGHDWYYVLPHLDDAMGELDRTDRTAIFIRFSKTNRSHPTALVSSDRFGPASIIRIPGRNEFLSLDRIARLHIWR